MLKIWNIILFTSKFDFQVTNILKLNTQQTLRRRVMVLF
jgi:hypothetical protein